MLSVKDLCVSYGAINALKGISFEVEKGEIISLIGSNGAGKTTTLHSISNIIKKKSGTVLFEGTDITDMMPDLIVKQNLIQVPEGRRIFLNLSVKENLEMGAYTRNDKKGIKEDLDVTVLKKSKPEETLTTEVKIYEDEVIAPVEKGEILGELVCKDEDGNIMRAEELFALEDVSEGWILSAIGISNEEIPVFLLVSALVITAFLIFALTRKMRIRRRKQRRRAKRERAVRSRGRERERNPFGNTDDRRGGRNVRY